MSRLNTVSCAVRMDLLDTPLALGVNPGTIPAKEQREKETIAGLNS